MSCVVTLGTGIQPKESANAANLDISWPSNIVDAFMKVPRLGSLVNLLIDQVNNFDPLLGCPLSLRVLSLKN